MARPRTFEPEEALQAIKRVFWKKGYEATSLRDIEEATELNKQSLYRLYVDKQGMYLRALVDYGQRELAQTLTMFSRVDGPEAYFAQLFAHIIDEAVLRDNRMGCFLCNAAVDQAQTDSKIGDLVETMTAFVRSVFSKVLMADAVFRRDERKTEAVAAHMTAVYFGLRVLVKANVSEPVLRDVARAATAQFRRKGAGNA